MKSWRDSRGNVWHRGPVKNSVTIHREWVSPMGDGYLEWNSVPGQRLDKNDREDAIAAIAKLWPAPTKDQLWRKIKRIASELVFHRRTIHIEGGLEPLAAIKAIVANPDWLPHVTRSQQRRDRRLLAKLETALAEYEAAE